MPPKKKITVEEVPQPEAALPRVLSPNMEMVSIKQKIANLIVELASGSSSVRKEWIEQKLRGLIS